MSENTFKTDGTIDTFENRFAPRDYDIQFVAPEFTSMCPMTGQPDFGTLTLTYTPADRCIELRSFKFYLHTFRDRGIFYEDVVNTVLDDVVAAIAPRRDDIVEHRVDHVFIEDSAVAEGVQVELETAQFDAAIGWRVGERERPEVGLAGHGAHAGEFGCDELDVVVAAGEPVFERVYRAVGLERVFGHGVSVRAKRRTVQLRAASSLPDSDGVEVGFAVVGVEALEPLEGDHSGVGERRGNGLEERLEEPLLPDEVPHVDARGPGERDGDEDHRIQALADDGRADRATPE